MPDVPRDDDKTVSNRGRGNQRIDCRDGLTLNASAPADFAPCLGDDGVHVENTTREARTEICQRLLEPFALFRIRSDDLYSLTNFAEREDAEIETLLVPFVDPRPKRCIGPRLDELGDDVRVE